MKKDFAKIFGHGEDQVLVVLRLDGDAPKITITFLVPGLGMSDNGFEYEDSAKGRKDARKIFDEATEVIAFAVRDGGRNLLGKE